MIDLSIIIVSYNTKDILLECISSVKETAKGTAYEIIVVDNASTDETVNTLKSLQFKNLKIIQNRTNFGFSKANNIGVKQAEGKYLLFLNSDTVVRPETLQTMIKFMNEHQDVGAATCRIELLSGKLDDACHRGFPTPWNSFCHFTKLSKLFFAKKLFSGYSLGWMDLKRNHLIDACAGAFIIVKREAGDEINWWDEDYFWYGEDLDLCYRLKEKGWKVYFVASCSILHYKGVSGGIKKSSIHLSSADKTTKRLAKKARFEAMRIFYKKHYKNTYPIILSKLVFTGISLGERLPLS